MAKELRRCQNCKQNFFIESEDFDFYKKIDVPPPTFCPDCRTQRRFSWRNERTFHRNRCGATGKNLISGFSPDSGVIVYERDYWWSDQWDPFTFGVLYDFSHPFFAQFHNLMKRAPMPAVFNARTTESDYTQYTGEFKNAYLVCASWGGENVSYASRVSEAKDSLDLFVVSHSELCYEGIVLDKCYRTLFSQNAIGCTDSAFLFECKGCTNCFMCTNLRNKSYYIFNKPYSREEYLKKIREFNLESFEALEKYKKDFINLKQSSIRKYANITNSRMVTGDNIVNSYNCSSCFDLYGDVRDCKFIQNCAEHLRDSYDGYGVGATAELIYEVFDTGAQGARLCFGATLYGGSNVYYSLNCHSCNNCFGCIGLRNKSYCILNKQYTKEEYEALIPRIIKHMNEMPYVDKRGCVYKYGEFFPSELSPFAYNETVAQEYFPLTKEEVLTRGLLWYDSTERNYQVDVSTNQLPDNINNVKDDVIGKVIQCAHNQECNEQCTQAFKIIGEELSFYRRMNLPLPRLCPNCRHYQRLKQRNPLKLWHRKCMCEGKTNDSQQTTNNHYQNTITHFHGSSPCPNEFETSYSPDRNEIVYCEQCYNAEVV